MLDLIEYARLQRKPYLHDKRVVVILLSAIFFVYENGAGYIFGPVFF